MGPKPAGSQSADMFRQRLDELVNLQHPLAQLATHIDWSVFEREWAGHFPSSRGRPATSTRLIAGLLYLPHTFALSDEDVVWGWVENPYWQLFCGETWFQHRPPIDPSSLTRWRKRIGEAGLEWMLTQTIKAAESAWVVKPQSFQKVIVDSTVQEKAIAHPTDSKLIERARQHLVKLAAEAGLALRQNYNREAPRLAVQVGRYAHAKQYKRMRASLKKLKTVVGRGWRDVERQRDKIPGALRDKATDLLAKAKRLLAQKQRDKNKLYSLHAPEAECIAKGKTRQPYEFGAKVSIATTHREGLVVGMQHAGQSVRRPHPRNAEAGGDPHRRPAQGSVCGPGLTWRRGASRHQGLPPQTQTRHHRATAARHPAPQRHRTGDRAHEERRQAATQLAQRRRWRRLQCAAVRLRSQPAHDPAQAAAFLRLHRRLDGIAAPHTGTRNNSGRLS